MDVDSRPPSPPNPGQPLHSPVPTPLAGSPVVVTSPCSPLHHHHIQPFTSESSSESTSEPTLPAAHSLAVPLEDNDIYVSAPPNHSTPNNTIPHTLSAARQPDASSPPTRTTVHRSPGPPSHREPVTPITTSTRNPTTDPSSVSNPISVLLQSPFTHS